MSLIWPEMHSRLHSDTVVGEFHVCEKGEKRSRASFSVSVLLKTPVVNPARIVAEMFAVH